MQTTEETLPSNFKVEERREDVHGILYVSTTGTTHRIVPSYMSDTVTAPLRRKYRTASGNPSTK